ncbi:unnamed protein product [Cuscuta epithymum]|uniref:Neprosin PEP catalytic domain-containing protein n=2 Tax=Cuscuta epithymum TaxID=186058 RepID=A0AAV0FX57_9ASTE|nr:unnamed protein product [Cuscuta epithymum]
MIRVQSYSSAVVKSTTTTDHRPCASLLVLIIIFFSSACSAGGPETGPAINETEKMKAVHALLKKINKPANKTIHSPDGDIIDCVDYHQQPAFDDPLLKAQKRPLSQAEWPEGHNKNSLDMENVQLWSLNGESCPEGTVPIRRTKEQDILRAPSIAAFGRKMSTKRDSSNEAHEHAVGYVKGDSVYYGAKAGINVWAPHVADNSDDFSISQIWITSSSLDNTIEAGWQVEARACFLCSLPE